MLTAHALDLVFLQHPQHFRLRREAHVANFVEEQRPLVGLLKLADPLLRGPGKGPLLVPKELALDELTRDGGAVHLDYRLFGPGGGVMDPLGHQFLSGPILSGHEDARLRGRHPFDGFFDVLNGVALANDGRQVARVLFGDGLAHAPVFHLQLPVVQGVAHRHEEAIQVGRLLDEVVRPELRRLHSRLDGAVAADHEDGDLVALVRNGFQHLHAVQLRHLHVEDHKVVRVFAEGREGLLPVDGLFNRKVFVLQNLAERPANARLVVDNQDRRHPERKDSSAKRTAKGAAVGLGGTRAGGPAAARSLVSALGAATTRWRRGAPQPAPCTVPRR